MLTNKKDALIENFFKKRKDFFGQEIHMDYYNQKDHPHSWNIHHIFPKARGGSESLFINQTIVGVKNNLDMAEKLQYNDEKYFYTVLPNRYKDKIYGIIQRQSKNNFRSFEYFNTLTYKWQTLDEVEASYAEHLETYESWKQQNTNEDYVPESTQLITSQDTIKQNSHLSVSKDSKDVLEDSYDANDKSSWTEIVLSGNCNKKNYSVIKQLSTVIVRKENAHLFKNKSFSYKNYKFSINSELYNQNNVFFILKRQNGKNFNWYNPLTKTWSSDSCTQKEFGKQLRQSEGYIALAKELKNKTPKKAKNDQLQKVISYDFLDNPYVFTDKNTWKEVSVLDKEKRGIASTHKINKMIVSTKTYEFLQKLTSPKQRKLFEYEGATYKIWSQQIRHEKNKPQYYGLIERVKPKTANFCAFDVFKNEWICKYKTAKDFNQSIKSLKKL
ncbi:hypothetical protein [[Mycoplasma] gypis]|uniref:HNH nuclease domain-containing protein n=1 Tax=[Mycoplasma] gypis TaxID=92404 RepID=A0ABZ2RMP0_9BACT|nr:hypothetical protein [[Mycoplasma] gypis]MBN0919555.1 hypothetical protein [[Mycoplasma] gypis]